MSTVDGRSQSSAANGRKGGRPKGFAAKASELFRESLAKTLSKKENGPVIIKKAITQAKTGDKDARQWLYDRAYGKSPQQIDVNDENRAEELAALRDARNIFSNKK